MEPSDLTGARPDALTAGADAGLAPQPDPAPAAPASIHDLLADLREVIALSEATSAFERELEAAYDAEMEVMEDLAMRALRMAEYLERLRTLGVIPADLKPPELPPLPIPLLPGLCQELQVEAHGPDEVALSWLSPWEGSRVHGYEIEKAEVAEAGPDTAQAPWQLAVTSLSTEVVLPQPAGIEVAYRVVARGIGGRGQPSEAVSIRLG